MLLLAADENLNNDIIRGILRRKPEMDIVRVQEAGLSGADDPTILEWAAKEGRILLTHDVSTITHYAYKRVQEGKPMPGIIEIGQDISIGSAIEDIILLVEFSLDNEWQGQILYLPL